MIYLASLTEETDDKISGYTMIKTKEALERVITDNTAAHRVIIRNNFAEEYFTPTGLQAFIQNAKSLNKNITIEFENETNTMTFERIISKLAEVRSLDELFTILMYNPEECLDVIKKLTRDHREEQKELLAASNSVSGLHDTITELQNKVDELEYDLKTEQDNKFNAQSKLDLLIKRINYQYNKDIDESKLFLVDKNNYDKIIYLKETTRVQFTDTFVYYLKEILKVLYNMPTRLVVVEGYYAQARGKLYPDLKPHYALTEHDVITNDIVMFGMQSKLMTDILRNASRVSILIVLDRGGFEVPHIQGKNVEYFYIASDIKDLDPSIPKSRIISYDESTLHIPFIPDFEKMDKSSRMTAYSGSNIIKRLVKLIEGR